MFFNLFGSRKPKVPPRDVKALVQGLARPAVHIVSTDRITDSHLGGLPRVPAHFVWPEMAGQPLGFLAQFNLAELAGMDVIEWLPRAGHLLFFYDLAHQPWGFDPRDRGSWAVILLEEGKGPLVEHPAPSKLPGKSILGRMQVELKRIDTFPSSRESLAGLELTDEESNLLLDLQEAQFCGRPRHQLGGFPSAVQGDTMELECQLVSEGLYCGDDRGYKDPRAEEAARLAHEWQLLFQMDSDDDLKVMWGDLGMLYFWNREQDSRRGRFEDAWVILQCH